jgi:hypothetical protein
METIRGCATEGVHTGICFIQNQSAENGRNGIQGFPSNNITKISQSGYRSF